MDNHAASKNTRLIPVKNTRLIPVTDWNKYHDWPPVGGLRHLIFNAETNGFSKAFKRVGKRVLIDEQQFFVCVEENN